MKRKQFTKESSQHQARISSTEKGIAYGLACAAVITLIFLVITPRVMNNGTLAIVRFLAALASGLSAYLFLGEVQVQGTIRKVLVRASGGFALFVIVLLLFFYGLPTSDTSTTTAAPQSSVRDENPVLDIVNTSFMHDSEFDLIVRNLGNTDLIIHKITITKLESPGIGVSPILKPTAKYHLPVDDIPVGSSKSIKVSHVVPARKADRFLIALETTTVYKLRVSLTYDKDKVASFEKNTWL